MYILNCTRYTVDSLSIFSQTISSCPRLQVFPPLVSWAYAFLFAFGTWRIRLQHMLSHWALFLIPITVLPVPGNYQSALSLSSDLAAPINRTIQRLTSDDWRISLSLPWFILYVACVKTSQLFESSIMFHCSVQTTFCLLRHKGLQALLGVIIEGKAKQARKTQKFWNVDCFFSFFFFLTNRSQNEALAGPTLLLCPLVLTHGVLLPGSKPKLPLLKTGHLFMFESPRVL